MDFIKQNSLILSQKFTFLPFLDNNDAAAFSYIQILQY